MMLLYYLCLLQYMTLSCGLVLCICIVGIVKLENDVQGNASTNNPQSLSFLYCVHVNIDGFRIYFQDFTATILLHLSWNDHRFSKFHIENLEEGYVEIDAKNLEKLWVPDLYFPNEKNAYYHNVLMPNKMLRIYNRGRVSYSTRYFFIYSLIFTMSIESYCCTEIN